MMNKEYRIIAIILLIGVIPFSLFAQKQNITSAAVTFKQFKGANKDKLLEAKNFIDQAYNTESTSNHPKMWNYRAPIYLSIAKKAPEFDKDAIFKATESYLKCLQTEGKKKKIIVRRWTPKESILEALINCGYLLFNTAVDEYNAGNYKQALRLYDAIFPIILEDENGLLKKGNITSVTIINNSFLAAQALKDNNLSKQFLQKLIDDPNNNDPGAYIKMSDLLFQEGNSDGALEYISKARERFKDDNNVRIQEINLYIKLGRTEELITKITLAIEADSGNAVFYVIRANCYQNSNKIEEAIIDYKKAIEINPENTDALNNIASCYLTQTEPIIKKMNTLSINQTTKYKAYKKQLDDLYKKALPHLTKYVELKPEDQVNQKVLKEINYKLQN